MIRPGCERDLPPLLALSKALRDESETFRAISIDPAKLTGVLRRAIDPADDRACVFVCETSGKLRGAVLAVTSEYFFSRERFAADLFLYVEPASRRGLMGGVIARRLWESYRDWAIARGVRDVRNGVSTGIAIDAAHRFFTSLGMRHLGGLYTLAIETKAKP